MMGIPTFLLNDKIILALFYCGIGLLMIAAGLFALALMLFWPDKFDGLGWRIANFLNRGGWV